MGLGLGLGLGHLLDSAQRLVGREEQGWSVGAHEGGEGACELSCHLVRVGARLRARSRTRARVGARVKVSEVCGHLADQGAEMIERAALLAALKGQGGSGRLRGARRGAVCEYTVRVWGWMV